MADVCRCNGLRSRRAPKRKLGQRRCSTRTSASSNRCVGPWGLTAAQGGVCLARSPVSQSPPVTSREHPDMSGPVCGGPVYLGRPHSLRDDRSRNSLPAARVETPVRASKLQCPPHVSDNFPLNFLSDYFFSRQNEFWAAHVAVSESGKVAPGGLYFADIRN